MNKKVMLRVLLVLSYIGSGCSFVAYLITAFMMPQLREAVESNSALIPEAMQVAYERLFEMPRSYFAISAALYMLSLVGVSLMWKERPTGFHCYTLAQLLLLIVPLLFLGKGYLGFGDVMLTILFVVAYASLLHPFRPQHPADDPTDGEQE